VVLDAHEYFPRLYDHLWSFRFFYQKYWDTICRDYLPRLDGMVTVCEGIAEEYQRNYGVECGIITNAPFREDCQPSPIHEPIRMIHHGSTIPSRRLENLIQLMDYLDDRFTLDLIIIQNIKSYYNKLRALSDGNSRITFRDPVPLSQIAITMNQYDIGLYPLPPICFNQHMALPNKIFEFIQARLAVAIWPSPEMARVVREHECGVVADDFTLEAMAAKLNSLSLEDIMRYKQNAHLAATVCCAETNREIFLQTVKQVLS